MAVQFLHIAGFWDSGIWERGCYSKKLKITLGWDVGTIMAAPATWPGEENVMEMRMESATCSDCI